MNRISITTLGDLVEFQRGYDLPKSEFRSGNVPVISSNGILGYHNHAKVKGPGITIGRSGTVGLPHYIDEDFFPHNTALFIKDFKGNHPKYIYYLLKTLSLNNRGTGSGVPTMNRNHLHPIKISAHLDYNCQVNIAKILSDIDAKIELNNRINAQLEAMSKLIYDYWFVQFNFPYKKAGTEALEVPYKSSGGKMVWNKELKREIPEGWEVKSLAQVTNVSNESINPLLTPDQEFKHYSIPAYDSLKTYSIEKGIDIRSNKFMVSDSDILVSKLNPWYSRVIYPVKDNNLICSTEFVVWRTSNTRIKNYLFMVAKGEHFISHCSQSATGTSNSHKRVNPAVMMQYKVPFNSELIQKFGATINSWIKTGINKRLENQHLTSLRDWLLPMLMNGQVNVHENKQASPAMAADEAGRYRTAKNDTNLKSK
ncbi:MAG: restriction endonuclease subunit S [Bacteroidales bacterium]